MNWRTALLLLIPLTLLATSCEEDDDGGPVTVTEEEPGLLAQATIRPDSALALARAQVPEGRFEKAEIEREDGRLIYSFDMTAGEEGEEEVEEAEEAEEAEGEMITEVHVDALSGAILSVTEERGGEEDEAAEAEEEAGERDEDEAEEMGSAAGTVTEESPGLFQEAAFSPDSAFALTRVRFPEAELRGGELEVEDGRLVYSLDLELEGEAGVTEVWVDARTGEIVSVEHEGD
jgi:uncharacterized membrane protein YkoI